MYILYIHIYVCRFLLHTEFLSLSLSDVMFFKILFFLPLIIVQPA